jgi:hypothetical protein
MDKKALPLHCVGAGWVLSLIAIPFGGGMLLVSSGLLMALGGVLLAFDFAGSVRWTAYAFGRTGNRAAAASKPWQTRLLGCVTAVVGAAFIATGIGGS